MEEDHLPEWAAEFADALDEDWSEALGFMLDVLVLKLTTRFPDPHQAFKAAQAFTNLVTDEVLVVMDVFGSEEPKKGVH